MSTPDQLLAAQIGGTAGRCVNESHVDSMAVGIIRDRAQGRADLLRQEAAGAIGGWLGRPGLASDLRRAYLLLAAANLPFLDGATFLQEVEVVRRRVAGPGHGASDAKGYRPPT